MLKAYLYFFLILLMGACYAQSKNNNNEKLELFQVVASSEENLKAFLFTQFGESTDQTLYSVLVQATAAKLRENYVEDRIYRFLHALPTYQELRSHRSYHFNHRESLELALKIQGSYFEQLDASDLRDFYLDTSSKKYVGNEYSFVKLRKSPLRLGSKRYATKQLSVDASIPYYLSELDNENYLYPLVLPKVEQKAYALRFKDGTIQKAFFTVQIKSDHYVFVLDGLNASGQAQQCIEQQNDLSFSFCSYDFKGNKKMLKETPALIGVIKRCDKTKQACFIDEEIMQAFSRKSTRRLEYKEEKLIRDLFDKDHQYYLQLEYPLVAIKDGGAKTSPVNSGDLELDVLIQKDTLYHGLEVVGLFNKPTQQGLYSVTFELSGISCGKKKHSKEICLKKNQVVYLKLPEIYSQLPIAEIIVGHRQNKQYDNRGVDSFNSYSGVKIRDHIPAFVSVQAYQADYSYRYAWRYWGGPSSSQFGGKYSEQKDNGEWEYDNLYEWPLKGHFAHGLYVRHPNQELIRTNYLRVVGSYRDRADEQDPAYVHSVTVNFLPPRADEYLEYSFTDDPTSLGDPLSMQGRKYGGGPDYRGKYPGAIELSHWSVKYIPSKYKEMYRIFRKVRPDKNDKKLKGAALVMKLTPGKIFKSLEMALGDTKPDGLPNKDGGIGSLGGAKLSVYLQRAGKAKNELLLENLNVGPKGVYMVSPQSLQFSKEEDRLLIHVTTGKAYLMGLRLAQDSSF